MDGGDFDAGEEYAPTLVEGPITIDGDDFVGDVSAIEVDQDGFVHIAYHDATNDAVKYASNRTGGWTTTFVDDRPAPASVGTHVTMALDAEGHLHLGYYNRDSQDPVYATNQSGNWVITDIEVLGDAGKYSSVGVASDGSAHLAFYNARERKLGYMTDASGSWSAEVVDERERAGQHTSLGIDSNDAVYIGYHHDTEDELVVATNATGSWETATFRTRYGAGEATSIATRGEMVRVAHLANLRLYVSDPTGRSAGKQVVIPGSGGGIGIDSEGNVHLSYHNPNIGGLSYATDAFHPPESTYPYESALVDPTATAGPDSDLAVGPDDSIHISYFDSGTADLKYVRLVP